MSAPGVAPRRPIPEILQTSAMDCGPAVLTAVLAGMGRPVSYEKLRAACHTHVDGTSVDTIEEIALDQGLSAEQVIVPVDFVGESAYASLPAILITLGAGGVTHFVAAWRQRGQKVEVMDPASGRRWTRVSDLRSELYRHTSVVGADEWREWAGSEDYQKVLSARLARLVSADASREFREMALADESWLGVATLEAAIRFAEGMRSARALARGAAAESLIRRLLGDPQYVADSLYSVRPAGEGELAFTGAVLVRFGAADGLEAPEPGESVGKAKKPSLPPQPSLLDIGRSMLTHLTPIERVIWGVGVLAAGTSVVAEGLLLSGLAETWDRLTGTLQRPGAALLILFFFAATLMLEVGVALMGRRLGRRVEASLRVRLLSALPRLPASYVESRPASDLAHRAHLLHHTRTLAQRLSQIVAQSARLLVVAAALALVHPALAPAVLLVPIAVLGMANLTMGRLEEADLRERTRSSALGQIYLDVLLGLDMLQAHRAAPAASAEHSMRLADWHKSSTSRDRLSSLIQGLQLLTALVLALVVVWLARESGSAGGDLLLVGYWSLSLVSTSMLLSVLWVQAPAGRSAWMRVIEILTAAEGAEAVGSEAGDEGDSADTGPDLDETNVAGMALRLSDVTLLRGGQPVLEGVNLQIAPGEHIAVVGSSGSGKSSFLSILMGLSTPTYGTIEVDGVALPPAEFLAVRQEIAWLDPSVRLWNEDVAHNALYGAGQPGEIPDALTAARLDEVVGRLPAGLGTRVGEAGRRLSGGEGQRLRFARAWLRGDARLVLLDEAFRGLDRGMREELLEESRRRWADATMLYVTHDVESALQFPRVLVMDGGRIVQDGDPWALTQQEDGRLRQMLLSTWKAGRGVWSDEQWQPLTLQDGVLTGGSACVR